jgi:hypothetical protein
MSPIGFFLTPIDLMPQSTCLEAEQFQSFLRRPADSIQEISSF